MPILKIKDSNNNWVGVPVAKGDTGENAYVWIKYSATQPTADSDMTDTPSPWIGLYSGTSDSAPSHYTDYTWYKFKGEQGNTGATGATPAFAIGTVSTLSAGSSATASITGTDANPVLNLGIPKGDKGDTGAPGQDGADGQDGLPGANPFAFTVTLPSANWSAGVQTVSNANFLTGSGYCYMVYASPSSTYAWQDSDVYADDVTTAGQMTFHCDVTPSADLVANVIRLVVDV